MLSTKALLIHVSISEWGARKIDRKATGQVETTFLTDRKVGQFSKRLLPSAKELEKISALARETRKFFHENTLPWLSDGSRILSSKNYLDFSSEMRKRKDAFDAAVKAFLIEYPVLRNAARAKLGELFNENEYPSEAKLSRAFEFEVACLPIPEVSDFRVEILDTEKDAFLNKMRDVESKAIKECYSRLSEVVRNAAEKLASPKAVFRDTLLENISDICALLPKLNAFDDQELEKTRLEVEAIVSKISPETCRENATERENAAKKLADINSRMGAIMGALKGN